MVRYAVKSGIIRYEFGKANTILSRAFPSSELKKHLTRFNPKEKARYYNIPASFDIETTSTYKDGYKVATMYEWTVGICGIVFYGRTWEELDQCFTLIALHFECEKGNSLIFYVHNLAFEFQWIRKRFQWKTVFALDNRKPVKAITKNGIEFRCSLILSGESLAKVGEHLTRYKVQKLVGDLDYNKVRTSTTPMTRQELRYCENDVRVVMSYIQNKIEEDGGIDRVLLTKTSYVRKYARDKCLYNGEKNSTTTESKKTFRNYRTLMNSLTLTAEEYTNLKKAFSGGFTHANALNVRHIFKDVASYDFTSSYPTVMISERFPMGKGISRGDMSLDEFKKYAECYCVMATFKFRKIEPLLTFEHPLSSSKCNHLEDYEEDNGRIVYAEYLETTCTEQDFNTYSDFYSWESVEVCDVYTYTRGYLPKPIIESVLELYGKKTTLKGIKGQEEEYQQAKELLNSLYGMIVTEIVRDKLEYDGGWLDPMPADIGKEIDKYNKKTDRFLFFPWGVWVTAYARRNLFSGIKEFGYDYIYSDTDSIKATNYKEHAEYINIYNRTIKRKIGLCLNFYGIDETAAEPKNSKGTPKPLGVWDFEGVYDYFKTLGAKRYLVYKDGALGMTVAGLNKNTATEILPIKAGVQYKKTGNAIQVKKEDAFKCLEIFDDKLQVPSDYAGKLTHTYIDEPIECDIIDYTGKAGAIKESASVHLSPASYDLALSAKYAAYIMEVQSENVK